MPSTSTIHDLHGILIAEAQRFADATLADDSASAGKLSALKSQVAGLAALLASLDR
jgi:hypothetical protein